MTLRIVLADDHAVLRVGLRSWLEDQNGQFQVVGEASDGEQAIALVEKLQPNLLVLDLSMAGLGGLDATLELRHRGQRVPILILTQYSEPMVLRRVLEAGANGYVLKSARGEELLSAVRAVAAGGTWIDPSVAGALVHRALGRSDPDGAEQAFDNLTPRERQILKLVAEGLSNKEIAVALDVAVKTVMAHRANLMDKLDMHNHSKLVQLAIRMGLVQVD